MLKKLFRCLFLCLCTLCVCFAVVACEKEENAGNGTETENATGLSFQTLTVDGLTVKGVLPNEVQTFSFLQEITVGDGITYVVSLDEFGIQTVATKTVPLSAGDNTFYIIAMDGDVSTVYTVVLRRKPMYTVVFNTNGGTAVQSQSVEEGNCAVAPTETIEKNGYSFTGWDYDFSAPITDNVTVNAIYTTHTYTISYNINGGVLTDGQNPVSYTSDSPVTFLTPTKENCQFLGWYTQNDVKVESTQGVFENLSLTAKWESIFTVSDNMITGLTSYGKSNCPENLVIPTSIDGNAIVGIESGAFSSCSCLKNVTISNGIEIIGRRAFYNCSKLKTVSIPDSVTSISEYAFEKNNNTFVLLVECLDWDSQPAGWDSRWDASNVSDVDYPIVWNYEQTIIDYNGVVYACKKDNTATVIGYVESTIEAYTRLTVESFISGYAVNVGDGYTVNEICDNALKGVTGVETLVIPNSVEKMGAGALNGWRSLQTLTIPFVGREPKISGVVYEDTFGHIFGEDAYTGGTETYQGASGHDFYIPSGLKTVTVTGGALTEYAFRDCASLQTVSLPNNLISLPHAIFMDCTSLQNITLSNSIKEIGESAFSGCSSLRDLRLPTGLEYVGNRAFNGCSSLSYNVSGNVKYLPSTYYDSYFVAVGLNSAVSSITIPSNCRVVVSNAFYNGTLGSEYSYALESVECNAKYVGDYAFANCSGLTSVKLGDNVVKVGESAFASCANLATVKVGNGIEYIGYNAFNGCTNLSYNYNSTTHIYYLGNDTNSYVVAMQIKYQNIENVTLDDACRIIYNDAFVPYNNGNELTTVVIPDSVIQIGNNAFRYRSKITLAGFTMGANVKYIGDSAFEYCSGLTNISLSEKVEYVGEYAFYYGNTEATFYVESDKHENWADNWCNLDTATITYRTFTVDGVRYTLSDDMQSYSVTEAVDENMRSVNILSSFNGIPVTEIGANVFYNCRKLKSVTFSSTIETIGENAFKYYDVQTMYYVSLDIDDFYFNGTLVEWFSLIEKYDTLFLHANRHIGGNLLAGELNIPEGIMSIPDYAFYGCDGLTKVVMPNTVTSIGEYAFYNCSGLTEIVIPDGVTSIGYEAFYGCSSLTEIVIPDSVTSVGSYAFRGCNGVTSITCPAFAISYIPTNKLQTVIITSGNIGSYAFSGCSSLTSVVIGDSVTSIGNSAFSGCSSLTSVVIGDSVTSIGSYAFYYCSSLTEIVIPDGVTSIGSYAFYYCSSLTEIVIPDGVTSIGDYAFSGCSGLTEIVIPDGVTSIGNYAFEDCSSLQYNEKDGLKYLGNSANPYLYLADTISTSITTANIDSNCKFIGSSAFGYCFWLTEIVIPDGVTSIGDDAFSGCSSLTEIVIPDGVTSIGLGAFQYCSSLTEIVIPDSVTSIGNYAFDNCSGLTEIVIPDGVTSIGEFAFRRCSSLTEIVIPDGVTSIGLGAFQYCSSLTEIVIPDSVTSIGNYAFDNCSSLTYNVKDNLQYLGNEQNPYLLLVNVADTSITSTTIDDNCKIISGYAFNSCDSLTSVTCPAFALSYIPKNKLQTVIITSGNIGSYAFHNCSSLTSVVIGDTVTSIGNYAFDNCSSLTEIVIPDSVTSIGNYAFDNCSSLTIYCELESKPSGWSSSWNYSNCPVVWGYTGEE